MKKDTLDSVVKCGLTPLNFTVSSKCGLNDARDRRSFMRLVAIKTLPDRLTRQDGTIDLTAWCDGNCHFTAN